MKFCRDCLHKGKGIYSDRPVCWHPDVVLNYTDQVTGVHSTIPRTCKYVRELGPCYDGDLWEQNISIFAKIWKKLKGD